MKICLTNKEYMENSLELMDMDTHTDHVPIQTSCVYQQSKQVIFSL